MVENMDGPGVKDVGRITYGVVAFVKKRNVMGKNLDPSNIGGFPNSNTKSNKD
jgi:hypothetical protein